MGTRYLTKSRFKLAMECPTKLFYTGKKEYANHNLEDPFLESLAKGGFQVGELAKAYYPGGHAIESLDHEIALQETKELLKQDNCIIFEAAIKHENLFIRVDVLIKEGNNIKLIEVKSSAADKYTEALFLSGEDVITKWKPYVYDVAFQYYVAEESLTEYEVTPFLMLVDKNSLAPTDKLNQKFTIEKDENGRQYARFVGELTAAELSKKMLVEIDVKSLCHRIINEDTFPFLGEQLTFPALVKQFADHYEADRLIEAGISRSCKDCQFRGSSLEAEQGLKSGYHACFQRNLQWEAADFKEDTIFELRKLGDINAFIGAGKIKFSDMTAEDVGMKPGQTEVDEKEGLTPAERRWLQLEKAKHQDTSFYLNEARLKEEMDAWKFPLHFIDFETSKPVIPLTKGERPYADIAFQFSHHIVYEDGRMEHKSQYLNTDIGVNPNVDFVRHLKQSLGNDEGTIFRYSHHENTILNKLYDQLESAAVPVEDKAALQAFIHSITKNPSSKPKRVGKRSMVDLCDLVEKYFFDPYMKGSTSIKVVLPAILNGSRFIQQKYAQPIYGAKDGIRSLNFRNKKWVELKKGQIVDPYQLLLESSDGLKAVHEDINNGVAAMTAYERLQSEDIPASIRNKMREAMLKYCELDTLAMVLIYEAWADIIYPDKK